MASSLPGVDFHRVAEPPPVSPLRSDVAGFVGRARRGPLGVPVRVDGWRAFTALFGGLTRWHDGPYAVKSYFDNGGELLHFVRVSSSDACARATWEPSDDQTPLCSSYDVVAKSPGAWAEGLVVTADYRRWGQRQTAQPTDWVPEVDITITPVDEPPERFESVVATRLAETVTQQSRYIAVSSTGTPGSLAAGGRTSRSWSISLRRDGSPAGDSVPPVDLAIPYRNAVQRLLDEPEVAIMALPDLHHDLDEKQATTLLAWAIGQADALLDRMVLVDPPPRAVDEHSLPDAGGVELVELLLASWVQRMQAPGSRHLRSAALYFPYLEMVDPLGTLAKPLRRVPPCGHVAGIISRLDRELGAYYSPANERIVQAVGLAGAVEPPHQIGLYRRGFNLLRCHPRDGLVVWGAHTLARDDRDASRPDYLPASEPPEGLYLAHRRLIHRLVRAIRRATEPLVFETNDEVLWLALGRAVTTVLMGAFRAGALKGDRVEEAFRIKCDEETNPPEEQDNGRCLCRIKLAPAAPMEFIELRIALSSDGTLEVMQP